LWKRYDYKGLGIIAEPYLDIDYNQVFYITDTGRRWDGDRVSVRDKVEGTEVRGQKPEIHRLRRLHGLAKKRQRLGI